MADRDYAAFGAGTAWCLRLTKPWHGSGRTVIGDSAFASVQTAVQLKRRGLSFIGVVKTATSRFPDKVIREWAQGKQGTQATAIARTEGCVLPRDMTCLPPPAAISCERYSFISLTPLNGDGSRFGRMSAGFP